MCNTTFLRLVQGFSPEALEHVGQQILVPEIFRLIRAAYHDIDELSHYGATERDLEPDEKEHMQMYYVGAIEATATV